MKLTLHSKPASDLTSYSFTWILIGIALIGVSISIYLTTDGRWIEWHLSRLGEGNSTAAAIFNYTLAAIAIILTIVGNKLYEEINSSSPHKGSATLRNLIILSAFCFAGVACFPFDRFHIVHNVFGYSSALILMALMLFLRLICPRFSQSTYLLGISMALIVASLMALYLLFSTTTLLFVELVGQLGLFIMLLAMTSDVDKKRKAVIATITK